jgi:hypothetical protein
MAACKSCGRPTFGQVCGVCKQHGKEGLVIRVKQDASAKSLDMVWSPVNRAWLFVTTGGKPRLVAVKNTIEEADAFVEDYDGMDR